MSVIPDKKVEQVQFCESHTSVWSENASGIGLSSAQAGAFKNLTTAARAAYDAAQMAKQAYRAAITTQNAAIAAAISGPGGASDLIRVIKGFANLQSSPDAVYALAEIPTPAPPTPAPAPGQPTNVSVTLEPTGAITLAWKARNAAANAGTFFTITRKLAGDATYSLVGTTGERKFTDATITLGTPGATYIITGQRGALVGQPSEAISVQFGVGGGLPLVSGASLKIAA